MKLEIYKALWGMTGPLDDQLTRIKAAGYDGIETGVPKSEDLPGFLKSLEKHQLKFIGMLFTAGKTAAEHIKSFDELLSRAVDSNPVKLTVHSARDSFSFDDQCRFYDAALKTEARYNVSIGHETHRGRAMFTPWAAAALLEKFPTLKLCADFSHWCCVCESLLHDNEESVQLALSHTVHIHARVGYEEGPQVTDPAAPESKYALDRHLLWWDAILAHQKSTGAALATLTPEFGPPGYLHTLPYTQQPVADLWQICLWMKDLLKKRYAE